MDEPIDGLPEVEEMLPFARARVAEDMAAATTPRERAEAHAKTELLAEAEPYNDPFGRSDYKNGRDDLGWAVVVAVTRIYADHPDYKPAWNYQPPVMRTGRGDF